VIAADPITPCRLTTSVFFGSVGGQTRVSGAGDGVGVLSEMAALVF
jgi:hypothetical protein